MNPEPNTNHQPTDDDELRQTLLELHYGLLQDDEAETLKQRLETDPKVARMWAETLVLAGKFAQAATVGLDNQAIVSTPTPAPPTQPPAPPTQPIARKKPAADPTASVANASRPNRFLKRWVGSLATAATLAVAISGFRYWKELPGAPQSNLRLAVQPVAGAETSARNEFLVVVSPSTQPSSSQQSALASRLGGETFDRSMAIVPATISFKVLSKGSVLFFGTTETSTAGPAKIRVPDDVAIPGDAVLSIDAVPAAGEEVVRLTVPLEPTRCLTFLSTDRPVYRPGETIFFRSVTLNRRTLAAHLEVPIRYELLDASGATIDGAIIEGVTERGVGNGTFVIPESAVGGTFRLIAKSLDGFFPDQSRELEVRRFRAVRLKTDLEFAQRSYGAGDRVQAELVVRRADDSIPIAAPVRVQAVVDEQVIYQSTSSLGINGELAVEFDLPKLIRRGEGTLAIVIDDGSVTETAARPIPILTGRAEVDFYPEGGYLVGGVSNRVYFAARNLDGEPIEIAGEVLSQSGRVVADIKTVRDGMGRFEFKPESGQRYSLRITSPVDLTETPWLPAVVEALPVLETGTGVFAAGDPISMTIRSTKRRQCIVRVVCRGELVGVKTTEIGIGETSVTVPIQSRAAGVLRVTVLEAEDETARPLVERLVYRRGERKLNITANVDGGRRVQSPGDSVRMTIHVTDERDQPVPGAVLGVSVVDDAALSLRQNDLPSLRTHFLLTSEIESPEDLEHADVYLDETREAEAGLDLLLGTQGWRRFVSGTPDPVDETFREALTRLLELDGKRAGLITEATTNDATLAERVRQYRLGVATAWTRFLAEVRTALLLIGAFWLVGLLLRPRKSTLATAGLLLVGIVCLSHSGCGGSREYNALDAPDRAEGTAAEIDDQYRGNMSTRPLAVAQEAPLASKGPADSGADDQAQPFVERVVRVFLGRQATKTPIGVAESRMTPDQLRRWASSRGVDAQTLADQLMEELRFPIRQYAHLHRSTGQGVRRDFAETLYWNPLMVTDSSGTATIRFDLSESLTLFRVQVDGHSRNGRLGSGGGAVVTDLPVQVEPKLPLEVTGGDRIDVPVGLVNATDQGGDLDITLDMDDLLTASRTAATTPVGAGERATEVFSINVADAARQSDAELRIGAALRGGSLSDQVQRSVRIVPQGFPFASSQSGTIAKTASVLPDLPATVVAGSLSGTVQLYPGTQSQLSAGLESILREPHGCFEQASASNYPNVMAYGLLRLDGAVDPSAERRMVSLLRRGYRKLTRYECATLGYEWFGNDPGHEALSAFGLMQFSEMAAYIDVDREMLDRTRAWLLSRRDGKGGFQRNPRHLHSWSVKQEVVNAYVLWALTQSDLAAGEITRTTKEFSAEVDAMQTVAEDSGDPYLIALSAITLGSIGRTDASNRLLERLVNLQQTDGHLEGITTVTQSGGISRQVETTALAILAWSRSDAHHPAARKAADWLINQRRGGGFGSTQATVLALKALIAMHATLAGGTLAGGDTQTGGQVEVLLGNAVVDTIRWDGRPADGVTWNIAPAIIKALVDDSTSTLTLRAVDSTPLPFTVEFTGRTTSPASDPACPIKINVRFSGASAAASVRSGDTINLIASVLNSTDTGRPMTVAVVGLPGGLEPVIEGLDKLRETGVIDFYELRGRELVLYWRSFAPGESKRVPIACVAAVGGQYTGPPSNAYLYYTAESKTWHEPLVVEIE